MQEDDRLLVGLDFSLASPDMIEVLLDDIGDPSVFAEIARANTHRPEILNLLLEHPETPDEVRDFIRGTMNLPVPAQVQVPVPVKEKEVKKERAEKDPEARKESLTTKIQRLNISARIQLALRGGREIRGILARDSNKEVMLSVLENGKITDSEIELITKSRSVLEEALRRISKNREWMKNYSIVHGLVNNPKTPPGIAVTHITDLRTKDLIMLEKNKGVAEVVRSGAKRVLNVRKPR
ncbi:MAG: hypothetical protein HZB33_10655 [Nitrospirae bacterium]|nr:hypothetical protein [Nitrospirota bacterium]